MSVMHVYAAAGKVRPFPVEISLFLSVISIWKTLSTNSRKGTKKQS